MPGPNPGLAAMLPTGPRIPAIPAIPASIPDSGLSAVACTNLGREAVSRCFETNSGFQMQYVLAVLSNGSQALMPRNAQQVVAGLCSSQGAITLCIESAMGNPRSSRTCWDFPEYKRLGLEILALESSLQQICGNGIIPKQEVCHRDLLNTMRTCYTNAGLDPALFSLNATSVTNAARPSQLIGTIIGNDAKSASKFCRVKEQLYTCLSKHVDNCPGADQILALSGYEHKTLKSGIDVICHDVNVYLDGLRCFNDKSPEVLGCFNTLVQKVTDLTTEQMRTNMPAAQYNSRYCQLRVEQLECDKSVLEKKCSNSAIGLKLEFECNVLPSTCKNDVIIQRRLQQTCALQSFARHLRSGSTRMSVVLSVTVSILSTFILAIIL
ncbi:uncharacterized protein LOC127831667 [Dreissena polymorpha]|uniref:uncharacterized protein LOC127831667 n=1 Tax=Dreissena polymorpha TaxID=45954 RepID=UPI0022646973|nr:uncharacterized protein LOC127831667 [Dreissena polymorpha]